MGVAVGVQRKRMVLQGSLLRAACAPSLFFFPNALSDAPLIYDSFRSGCMRDSSSASVVS